MYSRADNFIGKQIPFFLDNINLGTYYLYQIVTPCLGEDFAPMLTLTKISEKTEGTQFCACEKGINSSDILSTLIGSKKKIKETGAKYLSDNIISKLPSGNPVEIVPNGWEFPMFLAEKTGFVTKSIVVNLRDSLRWNKYKFSEGNYVDIMHGWDKYTVYQIKADKDKNIWLEPVATYATSDVDRKNPLPETVSVECPKFNGKMKASELNRFIRVTEWKELN